MLSDQAAAWDNNDWLVGWTRGALRCDLKTNPDELVLFCCRPSGGGLAVAAVV